MRAIPFLFMTLLVASAAAQQQPEITGSWTSRVGDDRIQLTITTESERGGYSNWGRSLPLSALPELAREPNGDIRFELRREAGTIRFEGRARGARAAGDFEFIPSQDYARQLGSLGLTGADTRDLFVFAFDDVTIAEVRRLQTRVADEFDTADLVRMIHHGAGPEYVEAMVAAGFTGHSSDEFVRARDHGVTTSYVEGMRRHGLRLELHEFVRTRDHGVTPDFIAEMKALGFEATHEGLIRARDHGVTPARVRDFRKLGFGELSLGEHVRLQDHGVTADYAAAVREAGYPDVSAAQLIKLRSHGVSTSYIRRAQERLREKPSIDEIISYRSRGVDW